MPAGLAATGWLLACSEEAILRDAVSVVRTPPPTQDWPDGVRLSGADSGSSSSADDSLTIRALFVATAHELERDWPRL